MSATAAANIQVKGLGRRKMNLLTQKARKLGMTPAGYVKQLVEDDLAVSEEAKSVSLTELLSPGQEFDEKELAGLVEEAREDHYRKTHKKKRR